MSQSPGAPPTSELAFTAGTSSAPDVERCPACDAPRPGRYCSDCGERRIDAEDFSLAHFLRSVAEHVSNLDGTVPRTLARIWSPGFLPREYFAGRRTAYLRPVQLFLLVSLVLFFVLPKTGLLHWGLAQYRETGMFADVAVRLSDAAIAESGLSREEYTRRFDAALWNQKRTAPLLLVLVFALAVWLFGSYRRFFAQRRALAAFSASVSLALFWWLFFSWYQTASVLGTLAAWRP